MRLDGVDGDVVAILDDFLLRGGFEIAEVAGQVPEALDSGGDVRPLIHISLADRSGPVDFVGHHLNDGRIVSDGLDADVPGLLVDAGLSIGADIASGFFDLIRKGGGDESLREKRVGIQSDGREKIVQLIGGKRLIAGPLVLRRRLILGRRRD